MVVINFKKQRQRYIGHLQCPKLKFIKVKM